VSLADADVVGRVVRRRLADLDDRAST